MQPVAPAGTYQASAADRLSCVTIPSVTPYSTLQHALQVRDDGSEYDMMASMAEDARIENVLENVNTLVVFVRDHQVDLSSSITELLIYRSDYSLPLLCSRRS